MLAALTILPALLSRFGDRIARGGTRTLLRRRTGASRSGLWLRWSHAIARRPWRGLIAGLAVMVGLAIPALSLRAGTSDAGNDASSLTSRHAYDLIARGFGAGHNGPLSIVVRLPHRDDTTAVDAVGAALRAQGDIAAVSPAQLSPAGTTALLDAYPRSSPQSAATTRLVNRLRGDVFPPVARTTAARILVGGASASGTVQVEHLLLGLVSDQGAIAGRVLADFGVTVEPVRHLVRRQPGVGSSAPHVDRFGSHQRPRTRSGRPTGSDWATRAPSTC